MNKDYTDFASKLNSQIYGKKPPEFTMEEIAKCKGSSQSIAARVFNQLKTFWNKGKFVTDARVKRILDQYEGEKKDIAKLFEDAVAIENVRKNARLEWMRKDQSIGTVSSEQIRQDQKMAGDLGKIFSKAAQGPKWDMVQSNASKAAIILTARRKLEKYDPIQLLRAAAYDAKYNKEITGAKGLFVKYLKEKSLDPIDENALGVAYRNFITLVTKEAMYNDEILQIMKDISKEDPMKEYLSSLGMEKQVMFPGHASDIEKLTVKQLLQPFRAVQVFKRKCKELTEGKGDKGALLERLFKDNEFAGPVLAKAALLAGEKPRHDFIHAYLNWKSAPNEDKEALEGKAWDALKKVTQANPNDLNEAYTRVAGEYIDKVIRAQDKLDKAFAILDIYVPEKGKKFLYDPEWLSEESSETE